MYYVGKKAVRRLAGTIFKNVHICIYVYTHIFMCTHLNETEKMIYYKEKNACFL